MRRLLPRAGGPTVLLSALLCSFASSSASAAAPSAQASARVVLRAQTPWLWVGERTSARPRPLDVAARARAVVASVSPAASRLAGDLVATATERATRGDTLVRFEQTFRGLPVVGRGAAVRLGANGDALLTAVDLEEDLPATTSPTVRAAEAAASASRVSRFGAAPKDAHLVVWPLRGGGARLAWAVLPDVPAGLPFAPRVIVDAETGSVIEARDLLTFAKASVYPANPTKTPDLALLDLPLSPGGAVLTNDFVTATTCVDNKTVKPVSMFGFNQNVHVCDLVQTAAPNADGDYVYTPADEPGSPESKKDTFSEVSIYYHASRAYAFFRQLQGDDTAQVVVDKPLRAVANLQIPAGLTSGNFSLAEDPNHPLDPFSNAFFSPAGGGLGAIFGQLYGITGGALWFGQGPGRDYAYDGDVVYHEFTHAVVDHTLRLGAWHLDERGAVDAPGAMNEGLADYFSSAISGDPDVGEYAAADLGGGAVIRSLSNQDTCPTGVIGEVHADSTLFSGALWQARTSLPEADRATFDAALYEAMRSYEGRGDLGYEDVAKLFLATLETVQPAGAAALEAAMKDHGVLPACERILEFKEQPIKAHDRSLGGFASPGTQTLGVTGIAPGVVQIHAPVDPSFATVTVNLRLRSGGGVPNPLGGGTPFAPVLLAKFGAPITWKIEKGKPAHDADVTVPLESEQVTFDLPEGATDVYLQVANEGQSDGAYDAVAVALNPASTPDVPAPPPADPAPPGDVAAAESGCACSTPGGSSRGEAPMGALAAAAAVLVGLGRRRRRAPS